MNDTFKETWIVVILVILLGASIFFLSGCMVFWTDQVFVLSLFKTVDANDIDIIVEPNYVQIGSGTSKTRNDNLKFKTIIGTVPVSLESKRNKEPSGERDGGE